jgi:WD40 repeat protein
MGLTRNSKNFNPFPGLRPFSPEESDLFFGRERESEEVLKKLQKNRFVTVIGASGSGKSSLIFCGVLQKIKDLMAEESTDWRVISFRPGNDPFGNLADAIVENIKTNGKTEEERETVISELQKVPDGIASAIKKYLIKSDEKILLIADQFEELFRYSTLDAGRFSGTKTPEFVEVLVNAVSQKILNIFTIVTMRSDFIGECAHYQGLTLLINNSNYLVPHMGRENYREAIIGPVRYAEADIDPKFTDTLLSDIGERTDQLPVLQHAMMRTWTYWQELDEPGRPIDLTDYDAIGTMSDAMSRHANEAYEELSLRGKEICERMFKTLTEKGTDNKGIRHPSGINTIKSVAQCTSEELFTVIEKFRTPSRSFITPRHNIQLNDDSIIDLSHESLMRLWDKLRGWVDDEAGSVQMYLRLSEASAMYQRGKTSLWRPPDLQLAINWRDQQKPTLTWAQRYDPAFERAMVYLRTSEKEYLEEEENKIRLQKRQMRRTKIVAMILGIAAIISVGFMLFAFVQKIAADRQTLLAEERRLQTDIQRQRADSSAVEANRQKVIADSSSKEAIRNAEVARQQKVIADDQRSQAVRNAEIAKRQTSIAIVQSDSAKRASIRAAQNEKLATEQKEAALRLRMLSIGKQMSVKSLQVQGQKDLQTLLAFQAYLFNKKNNGLDNDADIYAGLYNVARQYGSLNYKSFKGHNGEIKSIAFVPGKREFYTSGSDGKVLKWSLDEKDQTLQVVYSGTDIIEVLTVSPDASWLACGSSNSTIRMIPLKGNNLSYPLNGHKGNIKSLIFSFDGKYLYSAALDGKVIKWDISARTSTNISTGAVQIKSIDISSNGNYLAGISNDGNVIVWNTENNSDNFRVETAGKNIKVIRFKPDENILALGDNTGNLELWDIAGRKKISSVKAHNSPINDIRFNKSLNQMASASNDKTFKIWNLKEDLSDLTEPPITITDNEGFVMVLQFSPDGQMIVSGTWEGSPNLVTRSTHVDYFARDICSIVSRNMSQEEWNTYVAKDIPIEKTCSDTNYNIRVNSIKQ